MKSKVVIKKCDKYDIEDVARQLRAGLNEIGGIEKIVKPGDKVLIKVNLIGAWPPEKAVTTHPVVAEAIARLVIEAKGIAWIGDSSGGRRYGETEKSLEVSGIRDAAHRSGAIIKDFDRFEVVDIPEHKLNLIGNLQIAEPVHDADVIITVPKLKTHGGTVITGAVKNMFGVVPGPRKAKLHKEFTDTFLFAKALVEVFSVAKPHLCIMDGIVGMDGNGPSAGQPKDVGLLIMSEDSIAVDTVMCEICQIDTNIVDMLMIAREQELGATRLKDIEILGDTLKSVQIKDFKLPISVEMLNSRYVPNWLKNFFKYKVNALTAPKPTLKKEKCNQCNSCFRSCPVHAIQLHKKFPVIDFKKCTSCFCCHELCPESAYDINIHLFWRLMKM